ncbi:hypothetical protein HJG60_008165 [Phyllostomus discolor]|uniref:Uncharacterized protein n=1 Tax=Phyllostomus discolor TaxID=89673 RepID=A0A834DQD6_9CHIR|nr:hypothetical protein HJG60_008165 [Phyllostomus discolor]
MVGLMTLQALDFCAKPKGQEAHRPSLGLSQHPHLFGLLASDTSSERPSWITLSNALRRSPLLCYEDTQSVFREARVVRNQSFWPLEVDPALTDVAHPANQKFAGLVPSQSTCLHHGPGPQLGCI